MRSGAERARRFSFAVDNRDTSNRIVAVAQEAFPHAKLFVRAYDRGHAMDLIRAGVEYQIRETFESAMTFGTAVLLGLGVPDDEASEIAEDVRRRDEERLDLQVASDIYAGVSLIRGNAPVPAPLTKPKTAARSTATSRTISGHLSGPDQFRARRSSSVGSGGPPSSP